MSAPLILTLTLDDTSFTYFNELRKRYFPPERNFLSAHLTLFHHLPPGEPVIITAIREWCARQPPLPLPVTGVVPTGRGVAYKIESPQLVAAHKALQEKWSSWLIPQDRQRLWPHVTVQNKVAPEAALKTREELLQHFAPFTATGIGLSLWVYEGGPWSPLEHFSFLKK